MANEKAKAEKAKAELPGKKAKTAELTAKRLRTGEFAIWDEDSKSVILVTREGTQASAKVIRGASLKALDEALGAVVSLG